MGLGILFLLSTILVYINIEPFSITGILLSICYFPGLCLFAIGKRDKIVFEDLLLAFPISVGLSGLLTLALLFLGIHVKYIFPIIHFIVGIAVLVYVIKKIKNRAYSVVELNKQDIYFCMFALMITLLLSIPFFIGPNRGPIASHAFHHSSFVSQILNGIFPPENPGLGGTRIGYYWGFHAFIAALTAHTAFHHLQIIFILNAISLFMIFCIAYSFGRAFDLAEGYLYIVPLAIIGMMRSDIGIFFIHKLLSGNLTSLEDLRAQYQYLLPNDVLDNWVGGLTWLDTRLFYLSKFYNISAMPLAISLCLAYLLLLLLVIKKSVKEKRIYAISSGITIMACVLYYPPLAIIPLLFLPIWACVIFLSARSQFKEKILEASEVLLPYVIGILLIFPYLFFIMGSRDVSSSGQGEVFAFAFYTQSIKNIVVYLIPFPVLVAGIWIAYKKLSFSRELLFLLAGTALCLGLTVFTRWPFDNSYKFNYILVFFFAMFFVVALSALLSLLSRRWVARVIIYGIILLLLSGPLIVEAAYITSCLTTDRYLIFRQGHLIYALDKTKNEAYAWIRENTPPEALLMLSYIKTPNPCCGINPNYEVAAIAERNLYVIKDTDYTTSNTEYAIRVSIRERLFKNPHDPQVIDYFTSLNRPVYLLVEENLPDYFIVEARFKPFPANLGEPFVLVFQNTKQRVYRILYNDQVK